MRMDRIAVWAYVTSATTLVANPLGGSVYILVPRGASLGRVNVSISGDVVRAPLFQRTSITQHTNEEWALSRTSPGPWADFETDTFMMTVPDMDRMRTRPCPCARQLHVRVHNHPCL